MPIVRKYEGTASDQETALRALGTAGGALHDGQYVCVGDCIDTDEQV